MNRRIVFVFFIALLAGLGLWALLHRKTAPSAPESLSEPEDQQKDGRQVLSPQASPQRDQTRAPNRIAHSNQEVSAEVLEFVRRTREDPTYEWKHPINFYGKVVDEDNQPVAGATASFVWNDLSPEGTSLATTTSDASGCFSLSNKTGKAMSVTVTKEAYYTPRSENLRSYEYAYPEGKFIPDPSNPVVFHLRKKGQAEPLIHGLKLFGTRIDGTLSYVDLVEAKNTLTPPGDLAVRCTRSEWNKERKFDWTFILTVPDGGLIESTEEFMFLAPEEGYEPSIEIGYKADDENWRSQEKRKFFMKSRNGQYWARIEITLLPSYRDKAAYDLEWFLNTNGSRNLESDPAKVTNVRLTRRHETATEFPQPFC